MTLVYDRVTSSGQAVRDDQAIEQAHRAEAQRVGPVSVSAVYQKHVDDHSGWALPKPLLADQERRLLAEPDFNGIWPAESEATWIFVNALGDNPRKTFTRLRIEMVGTWVGPVFVNDIRARVKHRTAPLSGALVWRGAEGGGELEKVGFDLDARNSVARLRNDDGTFGKAYMEETSLTLDPGEPVVLDVVAYTADGYCEWVIDLTLTVDKVRMPFEVNFGGQPFRTTSIAGRYDSRYGFNVNTGRWEASGPGGFGA